MFSNFVKEKFKIISGGFAYRQYMNVREFRFRFHSILCHVQYSDFFLSNQLYEAEHYLRDHLFIKKYLIIRNTCFVNFEVCELFKRSTN
jgi:hypothetical protein